MSPLGLFLMGVLMTLIVVAAIAPLTYAMVLDGREATEQDAVPSVASAPPGAANILQVARADGSLDTLIKVIDRAGMDEVLEGRGPYTMFAPSNEAFAKLPAGAVDSLLAAPETLADVLSYHLVPGLITAAEIRRRASAETLQGDELAISDAGVVRIGGEQLISGDIPATNGVIHVIDRVLLPADI